MFSAKKQLKIIKATNVHIFIIIYKYKCTIYKLNHTYKQQKLLLKGFITNDFDFHQKYFPTDQQNLAGH